MIKRGEVDFNKYYAVEDKLFRLLKAKDPDNVEIIPLKHIKANYDWDLGKYILSYKDNEIPPKDVCKHIKKPLINAITKKPYVFYHGTNQNFDKFSDKFSGVNFGNLNQFKAHYFTTDKSYVEIYGKNIKRAILDIKKVLLKKDYDKLHNDWINSKYFEKLPFIDYLKKKGYNAFGVPDRFGGWEEIAVFESKDICLF
jgi:hypothetical protein